jgi:hypothetical protein
MLGCAAPGEVPVETALSGETVSVAAFSRKQVSAGLPAYWLPYIVLPSKPKTDYRLVRTERGVALESNAERSASGLYRALRVDPARHPELEWQWKVERLIPGADNRVAGREDSPVRLILAFHGDAAKLDFFERGRMRLAKALSGQELPYATLMYVWSESHAPGTVIHNPHTSRIRMIVVESGAKRVGEWVRYRRDIAEDYRKAFEEEPAQVLAVGVMTDTDNTRETARAWYGDITFRKRSSRAP